MDPITHAASGAVAMLAIKNRPATLWAAPIAALACASPDIDLAFIRTPLEFLLLHRGISHSLAAAPILGLLLALLAWPLWRKNTPGRWKFRYVWLFCAAMPLLHAWLDVVTTYGTMIFLPFSHYRVRLNSLYIIDPLVTLPLLWAIWRWRAKYGLLALTLAWIFFYPASGVAINAWHTQQSEARFAAEKRDVGRLVVLPDAFTPFFWRLLYEASGLDGPTVREESLNFLGQPRGPASVHPAANADLVQRLSRESIDCSVYFRFAMLPIMEDLRENLPTPPTPGAAYWLFYDLRFGSGLEFVRKLLAMRPDATMPFLLMAELAPNPDEPDNLKNRDIQRVRLLFADSGRDSKWHTPRKPREPTFWEWLVGLRGYQGE